PPIICWRVRSAGPGTSSSTGSRLPSRRPSSSRSPRRLSVPVSSSKSPRRRSSALPTLNAGNVTRAPSGVVSRRLEPAVFDLPVEKLRAGYYTDAYFNHSRATLLADERRPHVVVQAFQKEESYLG